MRSKEELLDRYHELTEHAYKSKDVKNMRMLAKANDYMFNQLVMVHPDMADKYIDHIEQIDWNNYLSENEAINISSHIINQDGKKGFHWTYDVYKKVIEDAGFSMCMEHEYNSYALFVTANMIYSDMAKSIAKDMGHQSVSEASDVKMALSCHEKAIELLTDQDHGYNVRDYFKSKMYDD